MGKISLSKPVKLIVSLIFSEEIGMVLKKLSEELGKIDFISEKIPFNHTTYYQEEMGEKLERRFISFEKLISPEKIAEIKLFTNKLELDHLRPQGGRKVNIDPGYLSLEKLVLVSTKNYSHRLYLKDGIYAELTLIFKNKAFQPLSWTYPDYASPPILRLMELIRKKYLFQLKGLSPKGED